MKGFAQKTLINHELRVFNETIAKHRRLSYYHTPADVKIDFIIDNVLGPPPLPAVFGRRSRI